MISLKTVGLYHQGPFVIYCIAHSRFSAICLKHSGNFGQNLNGKMAHVCLIIRKISQTHGMLT